MYVGDMAVSNTIISSGSGGLPVECYFTGSIPTLTCCDIVGNAGGDWVGCIADQRGTDGNISADPLFCDPAAGDFTLRVGSPCLPGDDPEEGACLLIGAREEGCTGPTAAGRVSWGRLKHGMR